MKLVRLMSLIAAVVVLSGESTVADDLSDHYKRLREILLSAQNLQDLPITPLEVVELWDLRREDVSQVTLELLNAQSRNNPRFPPSIGMVLSLVFKSSYASTLKWALDHFDELNVTGRASIATAQQLSPSIESASFLIALLKDKQLNDIPPWPGTPGPYYRSRVCDDAYHALYLVLAPCRIRGFPESIFTSADSYEQRDAELHEFQLFWERHSAEMLAQLPSMLADSPLVKAKLDALIQGLKEERR